MGDTKIEWTDKTWSPLRARVKANAGEIAEEKGYTSLIQIATRMAGHSGPHCERVSHGCDHCYSDTNNGRCLPSNGTGLPFDRRARDLVEPFVDEKILVQPLSWLQPKKIFVENQSDLFGEWSTDEMIDRVFAVMALCPQHTFQVLTKRPDRMLDYFKKEIPLSSRDQYIAAQAAHTGSIVWDARGSERHNYFGCGKIGDISNRRPWPGWPLPNVWLGVSVEDQATADARIPILLQTPAAVSFVSYEPALGPVDFCKVGGPGSSNHIANTYDGSALYIGDIGGIDFSWTPRGLLHWIIVGGESGPGARPFDTQWARNTVAQCKSAGVACFVKQLGAHVIQNGERRKKADKKGGDMHEWEHDLRVREFPAGKAS